MSTIVIGYEEGAPQWAALVNEEQSTTAESLKNMLCRHTGGPVKVMEDEGSESGLPEGTPIIVDWNTYVGVTIYAVLPFNERNVSRVLSLLTEQIGNPTEAFLRMEAKLTPV